jgi:hypothetical protein
MFTVTIQDEKVYRELLKRVEQAGESVDDVLRVLLAQHPDTDQAEDTPALRLLKRIDDAELHFTHPFDARDAGDILSHEAGHPQWRSAGDTSDPN